MFLLLLFYYSENYIVFFALLRFARFLRYISSSACLTISSGEAAFSGSSIWMIPKLKLASYSPDFLLQSTCSAVSIFLSRISL